MRELGFISLRSWQQTGTAPRRDHGVGIITCHHFEQMIAVKELFEWARAKQRLQRHSKMDARNALPAVVAMSYYYALIAAAAAGPQKLAPDAVG